MNNRMPNDPLIKNEIEKYKDKAEVYGRLAELYRNMLIRLIADMEEAKKLLNERGNYNG